MRVVAMASVVTSVLTVVTSVLIEPRSVVTSVLTEPRSVVSVLVVSTTFGLGMGVGKTVLNCTAIEVETSF